MYIDKSIQARMKAGPLRVCEVPYCEKFTRDCLQPFCRNHRRNLHAHGHVHGRSITRREVAPWRKEIEDTIAHLYTIPKGFRTDRERQVVKGLADAVRYVERWMKTAQACWPCVGQHEVARLANLGVHPRVFVLRMLSIVHYSRYSGKVLGTGDEIRNAIGRSILRSARLEYYREGGKRPKDLPVQVVRDVGESMLEHFGRLAFYVSLLCEEYRREAKQIAEASAEAETIN